MKSIDYQAYNILKTFHKNNTIAG